MRHEKVNQSERPSSSGVPFHDTDIITHTCQKYGNENLVRNGHDYKGDQEYHCKICGSYGILQAQKSTYAVFTRAQVKRAVLERISLRGIERLFGLSWHTVPAWIADWAEHLPPLETTLADARLDELWSFVLKKANQCGVWVALCRRTRQIVAYFIGDRSEASCRRLWEHIPHAYKRCHSFSDGWAAYQMIFAVDRHQSVGKDSGETMSSAGST